MVASAIVSSLHGVIGTQHGATLLQTLLTALGSGVVGGTIAAIVAGRYNRRQQLTDAKRAAYSHLIGAFRTFVLSRPELYADREQALRDEQTRRNNDAIFELHLGLAEVELVCSAAVRDLVNDMQDRLATAPLEQRQAEWDTLIDAMRADIGAKD